MVLRMVEGLSNVEYVVIIDNFFSNSGLFKELLGHQINATKTMQPRPCNLTFLDYFWILKNKKLFKNSVQETTYWRMHD